MSKVIDLTGKPQSEWYSNPNLLDNWYFADPIDQRGGRVIVPGTQCYYDENLSNPAASAITKEYTIAETITPTYASFTSSTTGTVYYVPASATVRGYENANYGIDRWFGRNVESVCLVLPDRITLSTAYNDNRIVLDQKVEPSTAAGKTLTFSVLYENATGTVSAVLLSDDVVLKKKESETSKGLVSVTASAPPDISDRFDVAIELGALASADIIAVKLELGSVQTLAHQDADGNWVLKDPPPNPTLELLKCQRYLQLYSAENQRPTLAVDCRPVMRIDPSPTTIQINGTTYYANSAEL